MLSLSQGKLPAIQGFQATVLAIERFVDWMQYEDLPWSSDDEDL